MINPNDATEVVPYLTSAATVAAVQKWLKTTQSYARFVQTFPGSDKWAHWLIAGIGSFLAAAGIHIVWNWTAVAGGQVTFSIPDLKTLLHGLGDWFKVYILQHTVYEATHQPPYVPAVTAPPQVPPPPTLAAGQPERMQP